jgi:prophage regulatory protein
MAERVLRKEELLKKVGLSFGSIERKERAGEFPKRVRLGPQAVGWLESEVDEWIAERAAARTSSVGA